MGRKGQRLQPQYPGQAFLSKNVHMVGAFFSFLNFLKFLSPGVPVFVFLIFAYFTYLSFFDFVNRAINHLC